MEKDLNGSREDLIILNEKIEAIGNFMIVKTKAGNARDLCLVLDRQNWKEIVGTIAGDDTILVIARTSSDIRVITEKIKQSV